MSHRRPSQNSTAKSPKEGEVHERRHHNFTIELFLNEIGEVKGIFIDHDQSEKSEKISGWEPEKLIDFIALHAGLHTNQSEVEEPANSNKRVSSPSPMTPLTDDTQGKRHAPTPKASPELTGTLRIRDLCVSEVDAEGPIYLLPSSRPFSVSFTLDLTEVSTSRNVPLAYEAIIVARQMGGAEQTAGKAHNKIGTAKNAVIRVPCTALPQGMYRFSAIVKLAIAGLENEHTSHIVAYLEDGELIEVY